MPLRKIGFDSFPQDVFAEPVDHVIDLGFSGLSSTALDSNELNK
jgi:hypothetical protein